MVGEQAWSVAILVAQVIVAELIAPKSEHGCHPQLDQLLKAVALQL